VEAYNQLADLNEQNNFAERLVIKGGLPDWKNAAINKNKQTNQCIVNIPLVLPGDNQVSSYIAMYRQGAGDFSISGVTRPDVMKIDSGDARVKAPQALMFATFDEKIFKNVKPDLRDAVCQLDTRSDDITNSSGGLNPPPTPPLTLCTWVPISICTNGEYGYGEVVWSNGFSGMLPPHLDHDMDGIINEDDPDYRALVEQGEINPDRFEDQVRDWWDEHMLEEHGNYDDFWDFHNNPAEPTGAGGAGIDFEDFFETLQDMFESIGDQFSSWWNDIDDWWDDLWNDVDCPDWGNLKSNDGQTKQRTIVCGIVYLPLCNGDQNNEAWLLSMLDQLQYYVQPENHNDLRDYVSTYMQNNGLVGNIDFWHLLDIVDNCLPYEPGFSVCATDQLIAFVNTGVAQAGGGALTPDQVTYLYNNIPVAATIAEFIYTNQVSNPTALAHVSDVLSLSIQLNLTPAQVAYLLENNDLSNVVNTFATQQGFSQNAAIAAKILIDLSINNVYPATGNDPVAMAVFQDNLSSCGAPCIQFLIDYGPFAYDVLMYHVALRQAELTYQWFGPSVNYNNLNWEQKASVNLTVYSEVAHFGLDVAGFIPVVGEAADLTNGIIYTLEGDWTNAGFSYAATVPVYGWASTTAKYAKKVISTPGGERTLSWFKNASGHVSFGSRSFLKTVISSPAGQQAHHIIPWEQLDHPLIQKCAGAGDDWHMNNPINGISLGPAQHLGSHPDYNNAILNKLNAIQGAYPSPNDATLRLENFTNQVRAIIVANPTVKVNDPIIINLINAITI
jgi:A nuclease family of the HNH/ENDO VII superfamily with conserved AHH